MDKPRIGFVGLGLMGHGIAKNLVTKGFPLTVRVNRNRKPLEDILAAGAKEVATNADLARGNDIVFLCVTGAPQVEEIVNGKDGIASVAHKGLVVIDTSTSEPATTAKMREELAAKGVLFVDAPLARTPVEAEQGRLNIMVGADDATFAQAEARPRRVLREHRARGAAGSRHRAQAHQQLHRAGDRHRHGRSCAAAAKSGLSIKKLHELISAGARQFRHLPDDGRQDAREQRRPHRPQVHAVQRDEGPALLHALHGVAARVGDHRRGRAPKPRQRQSPGLRRQVRGVADRGAGEAQRQSRSSRGADVA